MTMANADTDVHASARRGASAMAKAEDFRALASKRPEIREAFREVLRKHCPEEYRRLVELEAQDR